MKVILFLASFCAFLTAGCSEGAKPEPKRLSPYEQSLERLSPDLYLQYLNSEAAAMVECSFAKLKLGAQTKRDQALCTENKLRIDTIRKIAESKQLEGLFVFSIFTDNGVGKGGFDVYEKDTMGPYRDMNSCSSANARIRQAGVGTGNCHSWIISQKSINLDN